MLYVTLKLFKGRNFTGKLTVQVVNVRYKCIPANISAFYWICLWWKHAEVCEDIKFALHVFCMTTKHSMTAVTVQRLLTDQTAFIVWKLAAIVS